MEFNKLSGSEDVGQQADHKIYEKPDGYTVCSVISAIISPIRKLDTRGL
jgi:hypothetical protein